MVSEDHSLIEGSWHCCEKGVQLVIRWSGGPFARFEVLPQFALNTREDDLFQQVTGERHRKASSSHGEPKGPRLSWARLRSMFLFSFF